MSPLPSNPWIELSADFYTLHDGSEILVIIDDYSRFPVFKFVKSTSHRFVLSALDEVFAEYGIPQVVKTDNGPPFQGQHFSDFAKQLDFKHRRITPLWPEANGEVERMMKNIKKVIRTATIEKEDWRHQQIKFLRNYRTTLHSTTGTSPAELLFGRRLNNKLPDVHRYDTSQKMKMKEYADRRRSTKQTSL